MKSDSDFSTFASENPADLVLDKPGKQSRQTPTLKRETFTLPRAMEFFSEKELNAQIGFTRPDWPVALLKELLDNALDACESADIAPEIEVELHDDALIVQDNGPGLPLALLEKSLDYASRDTDKLGYVSPSRGQQGNALLTLWAAPFVATGEGRIEVQTAAYRREVRVTLDRIAQAPDLTLMDTGDPDVKTGTKITLHWAGIAGYLNDYGFPNFYSATRGMLDFNPHVTLKVNKTEFPAVAPDWQHWRPDRPTAPHWYRPESFRDLILHLLNTERNGGKARSVNEFIREFYGLSSTVKAKAVAQAAGLTGAMLRDLVCNGDVSIVMSIALLTTMQQASRPVKPEALGVLGEIHFRTALGRYGATPDSAEYRRAMGDVGGLPYVLEVFFAVKTDASQGRTLRVGINFSPSLGHPFTPLDHALNEARCNRFDPVVVLVHITCPVIQFTDRGKSKAILPPAIADDLQRLVKSATARFAKAKRQSDRNDRMDARALDELRNAHKVKPMTVKDAAYQVMEQAYLKASSNGTLPANARQIMYAARPLIIKLTGKTEPWKNSSTFTQTLLNDFITENPELCANWDVVFDDRGHFEEPHTGKKIGIGTLAVRGYIRQWGNKVIVENLESPDQLSIELPTNGPALRFRFALFIEKEGFTPLLEKARIAKRYDLAIMSTKGMSTTAARQLVEYLSGAGVTILVIRDFDKAGFSIVHTLRTDTRRYQFKTPPNVIDIGLRLQDTDDLDSEPVSYRDDKDPRPGLIARGATQKEVEFLVSRKTPNGQWCGKRVELNAMDSATFIRWVEEKLQEHGVKKHVPDEADLRIAWQRAWRIQELNKAIALAAANLPATPDPPADLATAVATRLKKSPAMAWDMALLETAP